MAKDYNPPAFPRPFSHDNFGMHNICNAAQDGMLMRDYFAASVLPGIIMHEQPGPINVSAACQIAYALADIMLATR